MLEVGKLYRCSEYFLLLFPDKDTAAAATHLAAPEDAAAAAAEAATATAAAAKTAAAATCAYWTRKLGKPVSFCDLETPLLVLSIKEEYIEVLAGDKVGWIINKDWLNIKEIVV